MQDSCCVLLIKLVPVDCALHCWLKLRTSVRLLLGLYKWFLDRWFRSSHICVIAYICFIRFTLRFDHCLLLLFLLDFLSLLSWFTLCIFRAVKISFDFDFDCIDLCLRLIFRFLLTRLGFTDVLFILLFHTLLWQRLSLVYERIGDDTTHGRLSEFLLVCLYFLRLFLGLHQYLICLSFNTHLFLFCLVLLRWFLAEFTDFAELLSVANGLCLLVRTSRVTHHLILLIFVTFVWSLSDDLVAELVFLLLLFDSESHSRLEISHFFR